MKLSVIITTRNRLKDLLECIDCVRASSFQDFELLVVDDCSTDGTRNLSDADLKVAQGKIHHAQEELMLVDARNFGLGMAKGELLLFIDDDNVFPPDLFEKLVQATQDHPDYGIFGPSMFYQDGEKYLDYQTINLFTGRTRGRIDQTHRDICPSDGVPNVFLIRRAVFDRCGGFDKALIQTFTEPDFAFHAKKAGYRCGIIPSTKTFHKIDRTSMVTPRGLGAEFKQKAYCLMRNRSVLVKRYGNGLQKLVYCCGFSWVWPTLYSGRMIQFGRWDLVRLYWAGFFDGLRYFLTGKLVNSLPRLL